MSEPVLRFKFGPHLRLVDSSEFQAVFDGSEYRVGTGPVLLLARQNGLKHPRLGLVMRKRFVRFASHRNQIKRQIRESFRHRQDELPGVDCVVMTRKDAGDISRRALRQSIDHVFDTLARKRREQTT